MRAELQTFFRIMLMLQHCWNADWSRDVLCTDACLGGYGAVVGSMSKEHVRALGAVRERRRFKFKSAGGRGRALRQDPRAAPTADADPDLDEWELDGSFPEVDPAALLRIEWAVVCHGPYVHDEPIHILEARAQHSGCLEAHARFSWSGTRTLTFMDNMSDVLALERSRAHNYVRFASTVATLFCNESVFFSNSTVFSLDYERAQS